jgi:predicted RNase H-like HicB family nuclease
MARTPVARRQITARFSRDESGAWLVSFPSLPGAHTYGRTLRTARRRIHEVLELFDVDPRQVEVHEEYELVDSAQRAVGELRSAREQLEQVLDLNRRVLEKALAELSQRMHLSTRDAGDIVGISHQRVAQLQTSRSQSRPRPARPTKAPAGRPAAKQ